MEKTNCIIIHGCPSNIKKAMNPETRDYDKHWIPWLREKMEMQGIQADAPLMPEPWAPDYVKFKQEFEKYPVTENSILIGHSCGCSFLVRWLGETKKEIAKLILVAPWKINPESSRLEKDFYEFDIDHSIADRVKQITMFTADNEEEDGKKGLEMFQGALGGHVSELQGHGHYVLGDMGTTEFPELLEVVTNPPKAGKHAT